MLNPDPEHPTDASEFYSERRDINKGKYFLWPLMDAYNPIAFNDYTRTPPKVSNTRRIASEKDAPF